MPVGRLSIACLLAATAAMLGCAVSPEVPRAEISNGLVHAKLYLPNSERGYYRGSRFDWSGVIATLEYKHHSFFGVWFPHYDPLLHDAITGPVEEFRSGPGQGIPLGFDEAKPRGGFVKVGVGVLRKPDDSPYSFSRTYDVVNPGIWTSRPSADRVEFEQDLKDDLGYSYRYEKTVRLVARRPELVLEHRLKNTGAKVIETDVYNHDFYVLDAMPTGPPVTVKFAFEPKVENDPSAPAGLNGFAEIRGNDLVFLKTLQEGESAHTLLTGFGSQLSDNDIRVENTQAGIGVREIGDRPLVKLNFWSIRTTVCPEAYIHIKIAPGQEFRWSIRYVFYELPEK